MRLKSLNLIFGILASVYPLLYPSKPSVIEKEQGCEYWVAPKPTGNDSNPGTSAQPWATLEYAAANVPDNYCIVWFRDGGYFGENKLDERFSTPTTFKAQNPYRAILFNDGLAVSVSGGRNMVFEGFEFRHSGPGASALVVQTDRSSENWSEYITFRNNIFHDSYNNDLLKIHDGSRYILVEGNIFYNQEGPDQHIDVNSVTDVTIQDNIFFNDFAGSGRINNNDTKQFIVIKDSNGIEDGLIGSQRITVRRNVFLNWEGGDGEIFIKVGNDGNSTFEAENVNIENNLLIGNSKNQAGSAFGVSGARNIWFVNNTVVGDLPSAAYAFWIDRKGSNPVNQDIFFYNNVWSDPTGTMGAGPSHDSNNFSKGNPSDTTHLVLDNNLYWNGGAEIPSGDLASPMVDDPRRVIANPCLRVNQASITLPRWNGSSFQSGSKTIRQEFLRLVEVYGRITSGSGTIGRADPVYATKDDILGRPRTITPDLGAYEYRMVLNSYSTLTTISLNWSDPYEPNAASFTISYSDGQTTQTITGISPSTRSYELHGLKPFTFYQIALMVLDAQGAEVTHSDTITRLTTDQNSFLPFISLGRSLDDHGQC